MSSPGPLVRRLSQSGAMRRLASSSSVLLAPSAAWSGPANCRKPSVETVTLRVAAVVEGEGERQRQVERRAVVDRAKSLGVPAAANRLVAELRLRRSRASRRWRCRGRRRGGSPRRSVAVAARQWPRSMAGEIWPAGRSCRRAPPSRPSGDRSPGRCRPRCDRRTAGRPSRRVGVLAGGRLPVGEGLSVTPCPRSRRGRCGGAAVEQVVVAVEAGLAVARRRRWRGRPRPRGCCCGPEAGGGRSRRGRRRRRAGRRCCRRRGRRAEGGGD